MHDPVGVVLLLGLGGLGVTLGLVGLRRGKVVRFGEGIYRDTDPNLFWRGVLYQLLLGAVCLLALAWKLLAPGTPTPARPAPETPYSSAFAEFVGEHFDRVLCLAIAVGGFVGVWWWRRSKRRALEAISRRADERGED
jgi:hypothetical protein